MKREVNSRSGHERRGTRFRGSRRSLACLPSRPRPPSHIVLGLSSLLIAFSQTFAMKIFSLGVVLAPPQKTCTVLSSASDLSTFSFYQRGSVGEFLTFFSKTIVERTPQGQRQSVQENNYTAHVYNRGGAEQLAGALMRWSLISVAISSISLLQLSS